MALSKEAQEWLNSLRTEGNLSDEVIAQLRTAAEGNTKTDEFLKGSVLRQQDYSRKQSEVQAAQAEVEKTRLALVEKEAGVARFQTDLGTWKNVADGKIIKAEKDLETARVKAEQANARLLRIGAQYGVPAEELALEGEPIVTEQNKTPNSGIDMSQFVRKEDVGKNVREAVLADAMIHDLSTAHFELFGKPLPQAQKLVEEALNTGKPLTEVWAEKYKVKDRQNEVTEAGITQRIKEAVDAERAKLASESSLPGGKMIGFRDDLRGAPVLKEGGLPAPTETGGGLSAAIAAFQTGKYKATR